MQTKLINIINNEKIYKTNLSNLDSLYNFYELNNYFNNKFMKLNFKLNFWEYKYKEMLTSILEEGQMAEVRGHKVIEKFGGHFKIEDIGQGFYSNQATKEYQTLFPLLTARKLYPKNFIAELLWILKGGNNIKYLNQNKVKIWDNWAKDDNGSLGPIYGYQLRKFNNTHDQLLPLIKELKKGESNRRLLLTMWNPLHIKKMALPPCHHTFQFHIRNTYTGVKLDLLVMQRSADMMIGFPYDFALYALMLHIFAISCGYTAGNLTFSLGNYHIYADHIDGMQEYLRSPVSLCPTLVIKDWEKKEILDYKFEDFKIKNYTHGENIKFKVAI